MNLRKKQRHHTFFLWTILLFTAWTSAAMTPVMSWADQAVTLSLQGYASPPLDAGFTLIRTVGNLPVTVILALLIGVSLIRARHGQMAFTLWALFVGGSIVELIGQHWLPSTLPPSLERPDLQILTAINIRTPGLVIPETRPPTSLRLPERACVPRRLAGCRGVDRVVVDSSGV